MSFSCPDCESELKRIQSKKNQKFYWLCGDEQCNFIAGDSDGRPAPKLTRCEAPEDKRCPKCDGAMNLVSGGKQGDFYSCRKYPECHGAFDVDAPNCPGCGVPMIKRKKREDESRFWGCRCYPECKSTLSI